jgi:hypothetical protein
MNSAELDGILAFSRGPAIDRLLLLMGRVKIRDLTMPEILALVAIFEASDQRVNAGCARVFTLIPRGGANA